MSKEVKDFRGEPRQCLEFAHDQRQGPYRKKLKQAVEAGIPLSLARPLAKEQCRKPSNRTNTD
jgi:hypothetical protein